MHTAGDAASTPHILLALRNEFQRFGLERLLRHIGIGGQIRHEPGLAEAAWSALDEPAPIVISALNEVGEPAVEVLREASARGVRVLLLVDTEHPVALPVLATLATLPTVGFLNTAELNEGALAAALDAAAAGEMPIPPGLARALLSMAHEAAGQETRRPRLSPREQQTLALMVDGLSNRQIARRLGISEHGAKRHVANVLGKLNCPNRTLAVAIAVRDGLCPQKRTQAPAFPRTPVRHPAVRASGLAHAAD